MFQVTGNDLNVRHCILLSPLCLSLAHICCSVSVRWAGRRAGPGLAVDKVKFPRDTRHQTPHCSRHRDDQPPLPRASRGEQHQSHWGLVPLRSGNHHESNYIFIYLYRNSHSQLLQNYIYINIYISNIYLLHDQSDQDPGLAWEARYLSIDMNSNDKSSDCDCRHGDMERPPALSFIAQPCTLSLASHRPVTTHQLQPRHQGLHWLLKGFLMDKSVDLRD